MTESPTKRSPFSLKNIQLFVAFRVFFNARFYYPIFTILFLDFGLSIEQFALLNTVWAITIVFAEVPSGVLADILGRKYLIVATSLLMMAEMCLLSFVPLGNDTLIFWAFLLNRVLSGLAEAMASGADEAIAYDTLIEQGDPDDWPKVLSMQMRLRAIASVLTMTIGALAYDPASVNRILSWCGFQGNLPQQVTMRFPIYFTLGLAILATLTALRMQEDKKWREKEESFSFSMATKKTWEAGVWIMRTPFALAIILCGMFYDHILRMIVTMVSQYFRLIRLPEASFGLIGSTLALLSLATPIIAEKTVARYSPRTNMIWLSLFCLVTVTGLSGFYPYWGVIPMALLFVAMTFVSFYTSHYLNRITDSHQRATVLSFKGLAFNLAYGMIGFFFALLVNRMRLITSQNHPHWDPTTIENQAFMAGYSYFPQYYLLCLGIILLYCSIKMRGETIHKSPIITKKNKVSKG